MPYHPCWFLPIWPILPMAYMLHYTVLDLTRLFRTSRRTQGAASPSGGSWHCPGPWTEVSLLDHPYQLIVLALVLLVLLLALLPPRFLLLSLSNLSVLLWVSEMRSRAWFLTFSPADDSGQSQYLVVKTSKCPAKFIMTSFCASATAAGPFMPNSYSASQHDTDWFRIFTVPRNCGLR